jgi:hypothetical protein
MSSCDVSGHDFMSTDCGKSPIESYRGLGRREKEIYTFKDLDDSD